MSTVSFGIRVPNSGPLASIENLAQAAREAEDLGFDSIFVHDHVVWSSEMHRHHISSGSHEAITADQSADFYESLTVLSYLAAITSRVKLGVACLVLPLRNPIYAAKQLATLDHLSGGRLLAGVGLGSKASLEFRFGHSQLGEGALFVLRKPWLLIRSALIGTGIGIVPAVGGTLASFLAYFQAAKSSKNPKFGRGDPRRVLAPEAANDAKDAGAALPTLALGIPGSADWAIILGAMIIHGVQPGPNLIRDHADIVWVAIFVIVIASAASSAMGMLAGPRLVRITRIRPGILAPIVAVLAVTGAFALNGNPVDVVVVAGIAGFAMRRLGIPSVPLILGLILGKTIERSFLQTMATFDTISVFVTRPISLVLVLLVLAIVVYEIVAGVREARNHPERLAAGIARGAQLGSVAFAGALAVVAIVTIVLAAGFSPVAAIMPSAVGWVLLVASVGYVLIALIPPLQRVLGAVIADTGNMENQDMRPADDDADADASSVPVASVGAAQTGSVADSIEATQAEIEGGASPHSLAEEHAIESGKESGSTQPLDEENSRIVRRRTVLSLVLIALIAPAVFLVGIALTVPVVLLLFMRFVARESWRTTVIVTVSTSVALYLIFVVLLRLQLDGGLLLSS